MQLDSHLDFNLCIDQLSSAASRALGGVIGKTKDNYDLDFLSYSKLYHASVVPILDYTSAAWGGIHQGLASKIDSVQHRAICYFCGLPKKTPILGMVGDMGWILSVVQRDLEVLRLYNQIVRIPENKADM